MKIRKKLIIFIMLLFFSTSGLYAGDYINFTGIETASFPEMQLFFSIDNPDFSASTQLDNENFSVFEDSKPVKNFTLEKLSGKGEILYLVFAIDTSKSMSPAFFKKVKNSAKTLLNSSGRETQIALLSFDDEVSYPVSFTTEHKRILNQIISLKRKGRKTLLYNCIYDSIDMLQKEQGKRKGLIVFSDGKDEGSTVDHCDIKSLVQESGIPVYFITTRSSEDIDRNSRICNVSGGKLAVAENIRDIPDIYKKILSVIRESFQLKYSSSLKMDSKIHRFEIRFKHRKIRDRAVREKKLDRFFFNTGFFHRIDPFKARLALLVLVLVILFILSCVYLTRRERKKLTAISGRDESLPEIKSFYEPVSGSGISPPGFNDDIILSTDGDYEYTEAWLLEKSGPDGRKKYPIYWDDFTIGRSRENTVILDDSAVSLNHSKIRNINGVYYLFDLVSDNGTFLNNKKLLRPRPLYDWDEIKIGHTEFIFRGSKIPVP